MEFLKNPIFATHAVAAAGSAAFGTTLTHPIDTLKALIQVGTGPSQQLGIAQVLEKVRSAAGPFGLYSGLGWSTLATVSSLGARFGAYELLTAYCKDGRVDDYLYVSEAFLSGLAVGPIEALVSTPFELFKIRAQVTSSSHLSNNTSLRAFQSTAPTISKLLRGYTPDKTAWEQSIGLLSALPSKHPDLANALKEYPWMMTGTGRPPFVYEIKGPSNIISLEGWQTLWRGIRSGIARDSIFGGVFFSTWHFIHIAMLDWKAVDMDPPPRTKEDIGPTSPLASSLAAGFSGVVAAAASHCFDTAKTRSQAIVVPKYISMERRLLRWKPLGLWIERFTGLSPADRKILFRGLWLRMARSGLASFSVVGCYYFAVDHLI
ncbi:mitochondrial tricarboxylate transporter 1 [Aristolochia californica]|uniref:mitochondrial tricarboxylate transporter 1 n=1 Tax=Aristolochia californica TaxID=171875 RepID=UPI0035E26CB0